MEIRKNRYGEDRVYQFLGHDRVRVSGNSLMVRQAQNDEGEITMYDFEGGPCFNKDAFVKLKGLRHKVVKIEPLPSKHENLCEVLLHLK